MSGGEAKSNDKQPSKAAPQLEWQTCANDVEWQARQSAAIAADLGHSARQLPWFKQPWSYALIMALALLAALGGWIWYQAQLGVAKIEADIETSVQADLLTAPKDAQKHKSPLPMAELDALRSLTSSVELLAMRGEIAVVRLTISGIAPPWPQDTVLRQTRLYQPTETGWQQVAPSAALWGAPRRRQSHYFDFHYYAQDEESVAAVAATIDNLYESLTINFQPLVSAPPAYPAMIAIEVDPSQGYGSIATRATPAEPLVVASPATYLSPVTISERELLAQSIMLSLLHESKVQALKAYHVPERWRGLVANLHLWQLWQLELPLAAWRGPLLTWILADLEEPTSEFHSHQPTFATQLCAMHQLWTGSPSAIQIPLSCTGKSRVDVVSAGGQGSGESALTLAQLIPNDPGPLQWYPLPPPYPGSELVMTTLFDYAATTYGKERLVLLVQSLHEHASWQTLVPAVFGVSASDFEKSWRSDLSERYHLSCHLAGVQC